MSNIGYHTRAHNNDTKKFVGGSFGGRLDAETVERLANTFTVEVLPSGSPVFVDGEGRRVRLYVSVDASETQKGREALAAWRKKRQEEREAARKRAEEETEELERLTAGMSHAEIVRRLSTPAEG